MRLILICSLLLFSKFSIAQGLGNDDLPEDSQIGKCYVKCLQEEYYVEEIEMEYPIYLGDKYNEKAKVEYRELITKQERDTVFLPVVIDENSTHQYEYRTFIEEEFVKTGASDMVWHEALCGGSQNYDDAIDKITSILISIGYLEDKREKDREEFEVMRAILAFQKDNFLPQGSLTLVTLDFLNIEY